MPAPDVELQTARLKLAPWTVSVAIRAEVSRAPLISVRATAQQDGRRMLLVESADGGAAAVDMAATTPTTRC